MSEKVFEFLCEECGALHRGSPSFSYREPFLYFDIPEAERARRIVIDDDCCTIDNEVFFIRGILEIPIDGAAEPFLWGLWVSQSADSFERYRDSFDRDQAGDSRFGWLAVTMPAYGRSGPGESLENLACDVLWQGTDARPLIALHEGDHPLCRDFKAGISWDRAIEIARQIMHPS